MPVVPGRPDLNTDYITQEIWNAAQRNVDIIVFPEMCVPGYLIGDMFEDECFVQDVAWYNEQIREATRSGITALFGSLTFDALRKGEDGRQRLFNSALVASNGYWQGPQITKTLQPNYRIFYDDRHFYSTRKRYSENFEQWVSSHNTAADQPDIRDYFNPIPIPTRKGEILIGVILCEDGWQDDYCYHPTQYLAQKGAQIVFNLSASPWTWRKNQKRHKVMKNLLAECRVPLVYLNNTGMQNTGKNIIVFDGSSTVYNAQGDIVFEVRPYAQGPHDLVFSSRMAPAEHTAPDDTEELYLALQHGIQAFFHTLPPSMHRVSIGISGGIDSALDAALLAHLLGPENVWGINMPSQYSSVETQTLAKEIARNLGIHYEVQPIHHIVESIAGTETIQCSPNTLGYQNIQARSRMEILAAKAQKLGGVFISNSNKVELAFGYGTLYGDLAGAIAPLGDLVKREIYQLAEYMNKAVYGREVIPTQCFSIAPSAELCDNQQDPFDYGNTTRRGYHDELVRAFTEFRRNPEWILGKYLQDTLEQEFLLEARTLTRLFRTPQDFVEDLETNWQRFHTSYFKRVQSVPIIIVSKRAFGTDLHESMLSPYFTKRYRDMKDYALTNQKV